MDVLAIDFGTSGTVGVLAAGGREPRVVEIDGAAVLPSAVYAEDGVLVVGPDAERRARLEPARFEPNPKRRVDDGVLRLGETAVPVADAFAAVLRRLGEEAERRLGRPAAQTRISHPAGWGAARQDVLRTAAESAGLADVRLIPEPVAAAAHYASLAARPTGPVGVYDLGAGTFDCAVVDVTPHGCSVLAEDGLPDLGGLDIDQALLEHVGRAVSHVDPAQWQRLLRPRTTADRRARRALLRDVRDAKESLSRHQRTHVPMPEPFGDVLVSRDELEALVRPSLLRSAELLDATVRRAGLTPAQLAGVYLVGGPSRMPLLATLLGRRLGVVPVTQDQPETAVAFGLHHVPLAADVTLPAFVPVRPAASSSVPPSPPPSPSLPEQTVRIPRYPARPPRRRKPLLAGAAVLVVAAVVAAAVLLLTRDGAAQSTVDCTGAAPHDGAGFSACLRSLAGTVPDRGACRPAPEVAGIVHARTAVTCGFTGGSGRSSAVTYYEGVTSGDVEATAKTQMTPSTIERGTWTGAGLHGHYVAGVGSLAGVVLFAADDRTAAALYVSIDFQSGERRTGDLVAYFLSDLKPV